MYKYEVILYWSNEDNSYLAEVPELAGCMADGETMAEALENIHTVMEEWIETAQIMGKDIPEPKGKLAYA
ncbi:type II toxin-antitoxin system HicB family antitoxin [uncultured Ruminococcus sp.]|uniref:type II toxin-antitoxin system HicB family antitoxin n=1 Tax=uncultured Ruminococcus sp. TaxID=165186 RepID=UPI0026755025|nr:type II toxin-antitoxin system HicB family antitoxin [uncultured Ruminococcus sp.]